ncbi:MAG: hypothetical protein IPJ46_13650 [Anaerolineales bacterium]|nr:hypothetical protein [Anaerolineales bacterium]
MPRKSLDHQLQLIRDDLYTYGMVETALADSVTALKDRDWEESCVIQKNDVQINTKRFELEGQIIAVIGAEGPVSHDLRFLVSALSICTELERIGDYAKTIARINMMIEGLASRRM